MSKIRFASEEYVDSKLTNAATVQPDWAQNDAGASDYVKNRTHWVNNTLTTETIYSGNLEIYNSDSFKYVEVTFNKPIVEGNQYLIQFNEQEYLLVAKSEPYQDSKQIYISDAFLDDNFDKTPFYIYAEEDYPDAPAIVVNEDGTYNIIVQEVTERETYHPLSEKYIPDTIARKTDLEAAINAAIGNAIGGSY